ncbi:MAG: universal stress protein [Thaumarchaeota archaeon]|nr:universal stress protein [Nitrososphaerota archaeon]
MGNILVAVDGSKYSDRVVDYSCGLAKKLSSKITLLYVSRYPELIEEYVSIEKSPEPQAERSVAIAEGVVSKLGDRVKNQGVPYEVVIESGNPATKILEKASEMKVDMIVVGLKGLHGVDEIRSLGSVARRVIESAQCPVVVVTEEK